MKSTLLKTCAAAAAAGVIAAYWYWSPFVTLWQMRSAAQDRDAAAFSSHVDFPSLRDSLKGQFAVLFSDRPGQPADAGDSIAHAGAAFGKMLGLLVVDKFVDVMVRPEVLMLAMRQGYLEQKAKSPLPHSAPAPAAAPATSAGAAAPSGTPATADAKPKWIYRREGANRLVIYTAAALPGDATAMERFGLVLLRTGFVDWKLAQVVLPAATENR